MNVRKASIRKATVKFRPRNLDLGSSNSVTWSHYSASTRKEIFNYVSGNLIHLLKLTSFVSHC